MKNIKSRKIILFILVLSIIIVIGLLISKFTTAYFAPSLGDDVVKRGEVTATGDSIIFTSGNSLSISATTDNFTTGGSNLTSTTNPKVQLIASSKKNQAEATYYVGFNINSNSYNYSTTSNTAEVLLTIKDNNNTAITSIEGLTYTTSGGVSGFDITNKTGLFDVVLDKAISTTSSTTGTTHTWTFTLTFVNLSTDQSINENASMDIEVYINDTIPNLSDFCSSGTKLATCIKTFAGKGFDLSKIYYHDSSLTNGAGDNSYRYAGASDVVNNYVCFGSTSSTCPDDNKYRIIGVFGDQVKLIKANSIGTYPWDSNGSNTWTNATLNTYLNETYYNSLGEFKSKISTITWKTGGNIYAKLNTVTAAVAYQNEIVNPATNTSDSKTSFDGVIGLVYVNEYGFAAKQEAWTININSYNNSIALNSNWLFASLDEWTISRYADFSNLSYRIYSSGVIFNGGVVDSYHVRPCFYLNSSVTYASGTGTSIDPIRIN